MTEEEKARRIYEMVMYPRTGHPNSHASDLSCLLQTILFVLGAVFIVYFQSWVFLGGLILASFAFQAICEIVRKRKGCLVHHCPFTPKTVWTRNHGLYPSISRISLRVRASFFPNAFPHWYGQKIVTAKPHKRFKRQVIHYCKECEDNESLFGSFYYSLFPYRSEWSVAAIAISKSLMGGLSAPWVLFEYGTIMVVPEPIGDLAEQATMLLRERGTFDFSAPAQDFEVVTLDEGKGWVVHGPQNDLKNVILRLESQFEDDMELCARLRRDEDAYWPVIVHIENVG